jgi:hyperosmotically inducible protein
MLKKFILWIAIIGGFFSLSVQDIFAQTTAIEEQAEKARIERKVNKEILSLPYYGVFDAIGFKLEGQTVTLEGDVIRPRTSDYAEQEVKEIEGVEKVINNIEILPPSPSDDRIRDRIYRTMINRAGLYRYLIGANPSIRIVVDRGRVRLEGFVTYQSDKILAGMAATETFGVFKVENNLNVDKIDKPR